MSKIHHLLSIDPDKAITSNSRQSIKMLVNAISIVLISCMAVPTTIAQPTSPPPETTPPPPGQEQPQQSPETSKTPEQLQQNSYFGFGGVIGIQGGTTSLSQGTFSILSKQVLTNNLAIHSDATIFGSLTPSASVALTFNKSISSDSLPITFTPFLGAGIMAHDENGIRINPLITGGVDLSTPTNLTLTVRANAGFVKDRKADVGVLFGIGYNY
jgi:hypothetical protein